MDQLYDTEPGQPRVPLRATPEGYLIVQIAGGGGGGGSSVTNLTTAVSPTNVVVASDTGTDATIPLADATNAGAMSPAAVTQLAGLGTAATANAGDFAASGHTHTLLMTPDERTKLGDLPAAAALTTSLAGKMLNTLAAMQTAFNAGTAPEKAAFQASVSGVGILTLPLSNGSNDSAVINAALQSATATTCRGKVGETYYVDAPIVLPSGKTLDMTGCTVQQTAGIMRNMLQTSALTNARTLNNATISQGSTAVSSAAGAFSPEDVGKPVRLYVGDNGVPCFHDTTVGAVVSATQITLTAAPPFVAPGFSGPTMCCIGTRDRGQRIRGGKWVRYTSVFEAGSNNTYHNFLIRRADDLIIEDIECGSGAGKYMISLGDVRGFEIRRITLADAPSDGVHVGGWCFAGEVKKIRGSTGDDLFAITAADYTSYNDCYGDVSDILVEDAKYKYANAPGRFLVNSDASPSTLSNIKVRRVTLRKVGSERITSTNALQLGKIVLSGVLEGIVIDETACVIINARDSTLGTMWLNDLKITNYKSNFAFPDFAMWLQQPFGRVSVDGWDLSETNTAQRYGIIVGAAGVPLTAGSVTIKNATVTCPLIRLVSLLYPNITMDYVKVQDSRLTGSGSSRLVDIGGSSSLARVCVENTVTTGTLWDISHGGTGVCSVSLINTALGGTNSIRLANAPTVSLTAIGSTIAPPTVAGTASLTSDAPSTRVDVSLLTRTQGSMAYNTNAALSCGVGPVACIGAVWKNLYSGATY